MDLNDNNQVTYKYFVMKPGATLTAHLDSPDGPVAGRGNVPFSNKGGLAAFEISTDNKVHDVYIVYENKSLGANEKNDLIYFEWIAITKDLPGKGTAAYEANKKMYWKLLTTPQITVPVMVENPASFHRKTFVFEKGNRFTPGKEVQPRVPASLAAAMPKNRFIRSTKT